MSRTQWCHETIDCHLQQSYQEKFCEEKWFLFSAKSFFVTLLIMLRSKLHRETEEEGEGGDGKLSVLLPCELNGIY